MRIVTQSDPPIQHRRTPTQYDLLKFAQHFTLPSTILSRKLLPIGNQTVVVGATKVDKSGQRERRGAEKLFLEAQRPLWGNLGCDVAAPALTWEGLFINQTAQPELHKTLPSLECQHKLEEKHLSCNYGGWWLVEMWTLFLVDRPFANHHQGSGRLITFNQPTNIQNCFSMWLSHLFLRKYISDNRLSLLSMCVDCLMTMLAKIVWQFAPLVGCCKIVSQSSKSHVAYYPQVELFWDWTQYSLCVSQKVEL